MALRLKRTPDCISSLTSQRLVKLIRLSAGRLAGVNANGVKAFFLYWVIVRLGCTPNSLDPNRGVAGFTRGAGCNDVAPSSG